MSNNIQAERDLKIKFGGITNPDSKLVFYYDESNNDRKIRIKEGELNVETLRNFALGGIVETPDSDFDFENLKRRIGFQAGKAELKFSDIGKGNFLIVLGSMKLNHVLNWLLESNLNIHFFNLNPLYWGVVDIIDSIYGQDPDNLDPRFHRKIKNDLYKAISRNLDTFVQLVEECNYPDVPLSKLQYFLFSLVHMVNLENAGLDDWERGLIAGILANAVHYEELEFIQGFEAKHFIDSFHPFYLERITIYIKSEHIFDNEKQVEDEIEGFEMRLDDGTKSNYRFVDSVEEPKIQVSDVVVGLLGKYFTYLKDVELEQLISDKHLLNERQKTNLSLLKTLVDKSIATSSGFAHWLVPDSECIKHEVFMNGADPNQFNI
ncbi:DUF3800 domain-containing protein [Salinicola aestuarinus]|uniref:DUF3800 domain-containing protein n=1 Tax=Salinicola aestuarinus TaxID=1949082 RepID=UPI001300683C|nr:DUF3800 domain-containing protein [Salinicola aestuarinus]